MKRAKTTEIEIRLSRTVRTRLEKLYSPCRKMIAGILESHGVCRAGVSVTFVGRDKISRLNRDYLGHRGQTDVLAFDLSDGVKSDRGEAIFGDIYIGVPRAFAQAADHGVKAGEELLRLAAHGVLHLLGYAHENPDPARRMFALQEKWVVDYSGQLPDLAYAGQ